jgi:hypothetical protein
MYGVKKTTLYLPDDLKSSLERLAASTDRSEADLIREGVRLVLSRATPPKPRLPLTDRGLGDRCAAERVEVLLAGFGER